MKIYVFLTLCSLKIFFSICSTFSCHWLFSDLIFHTFKSNVDSFHPLFGYFSASGIPISSSLFVSPSPLILVCSWRNIEPTCSSLLTAFLFTTHPIKLMSHFLPYIGGKFFSLTSCNGWIETTSIHSSLLNCSCDYFTI